MATVRVALAGSGAAEVMAVVEAEAAVCFAAGCQVSGCSKKEIRV